MIMLLPQALCAFLISIFGQAYPYHDDANNPYNNKPLHELRAEKDNHMIARPLELIDGSYAVKK
jgi:hypothetical protein